MIKIIYYYSHAHTDTGSPQALLGFIDTLDRKKYKPYFLETQNGPLIDVLKARDVTILHSKLPPKLNIKNILMLRQIFLNNDIKLLHVNEFDCALNVLLAAYLSKVKIILHVHNPISLSWINIRIFLASKVLLGSKATMDQVENFFYIARKTEVVYNSINVENIEKAESIRAEFTKSDSELLIGVIAQLTPNKGTDKIVEIADVLKKKGYNNLKFLLAGRIHEGCEEFVQQLKVRINNLGLSDKVILLGIRNDIPAILNSIDIFILLTRNENFGLAVAEAMAAKLPIITCRVGAIPELLPDESLAFLVDKDLASDKVADILRFLIDNKNLRYQMGENAKRSMINRLDRQACGSKLNAIYNKLLS